MRKLALLLVLALGACASQAQTVSTPVGVVTLAPTSSGDPLQQLAAFTVADLQAASADAKAQTPPDVTAAQCYDFLAATIPTLHPPGAPATVGAFVAFQKLRDIASGAATPSSLLTNLNLACAPLVIDAQTTINKLLVLGAGVAGTGGALAPALGAINQLLPVPLP